MMRYSYLPKQNSVSLQSVHNKGHPNAVSNISLLYLLHIVFYCMETGMNCDFQRLYEKQVCRSFFLCFFNSNYRSAIVFFNVIGKSYLYTNKLNLFSTYESSFVGSGQVGRFLCSFQTFIFRRSQFYKKNWFSVKIHAHFSNIGTQLYSYLSMYIKL